MKNVMKNSNKQKTKQKSIVNIESKSTDISSLIFVDEKNINIQESVKNKDKELSEDSKTELRLLYTFAIGDAKFVKEQQWRIINYVIAAYITIYGIWKTVIPIEKKYLNSIEFWVLFSIGVVIGITGIWLIKIEQDLLNRSRCRIRNTIKTFTEEFNEAFSDVKPDVSNFEKEATYFIQQAIIILGFLSLVYTLSWK